MRPRPRRVCTCYPHKVTLKTEGVALSGAAWDEGPSPPHLPAAGQAAGPRAEGAESQPTPLEKTGGLHRLLTRQGRALPGARPPLPAAPPGRARPGAPKELVPRLWQAADRERETSQRLF